jgi:hypothetical protein
MEGMKTPEIVISGKRNGEGIVIMDSLCGRSREIIQFHIDRCRDILRIVDNEPAGPDEIAFQHFKSTIHSSKNGVLLWQAVLTLEFKVFHRHLIYSILFKII